MARGPHLRCQILSLPMKQYSRHSLDGLSLPPHPRQNGHELLLYLAQTQHYYARPPPLEQVLWLHPHPRYRVLSQFRMCYRANEPIHRPDRPAFDLELCHPARPPREHQTQIGIHLLYIAHCVNAVWVCGHSHPPPLARRWLLPLKIATNCNPLLRGPNVNLIFSKNTGLIAHMSFDLQ